MVCRGGGVAQLGERLLCKQEVDGSIPFTSTILRHARGALCRMSSEARRAKEDKQIWIGRSNEFVGQQRPAFAIFDIVKSGVTEEASADAKSNLSAEEHFGNAEETSAVVLVFPTRWTIRSSEECLHVRLVFLAGLCPASDGFSNQASRKGIW